MKKSGKGRVRSQGKKPIAVDLFCGAGGMSLGFEQAGFLVAVAVDASDINVAVHGKNFPDATTICEDVSKLNAATIRERAGLGKTDIAVVFGGPPCQGFSVGGKKEVNDPRNNLLLEFARLVIELRPRYFVMENVGGLLHSRYTPLLRKFKRVLRTGGYAVVEPICRLDAADFGVPQRRKRVFVLGCRDGQQRVSYPLQRDTHVTVGAAIDDLKAISQAGLVDGDSYSGPLGTPSAYAKHLRKARGRHGKKARIITGFAGTKHSPTVTKRFRRVKQGGVDPVSRFIRLRRSGVAPTLRAGTGFENGRFMAPRPIHPDYPRCITLREAARVHSFPDWFVFHETKWHGFMQVGNSVPPMFAQAVADEVMKALES